MKNCLVAILLLAATIVALPAQSQAPSTLLVMGAHWDDGSSLEGTVSLGQPSTSGPDTVIVTKTLSAGWTNVSEPLGASTMYNVTLRNTAGVQLIKFPITTALINPGNLNRAEIDLIFRKADNSVKTANISVSMGF